MTYLWEREGWPNLDLDFSAAVPAIAALGPARGRLAARLEALGIGERNRLTAETLIEDTAGTSSIEGASLPPASVRSSVARCLGLDRTGLPRPRRDIDGLVALLDDATRHHASPLTTDRLHGWHAGLFPTGHSGIERIVVADWRRVPVSVQSGKIGREHMHFEGPPPEHVAREMERFLDWWNLNEPAEGTLRAGLAHLWFETIHPYEDGNGRIGRALADMALAQADGSTVRAYSLSRQILEERADYYRNLEAAQHGELDVTPWILWFVGCVSRAIEYAERQVDVALTRGSMHRRLGDLQLNARQRKVLTNLIEHEPDGFEGGLSNAKYRSMTEASKATAARDLAELVELGALSLGESGGRSTRYMLGQAIRNGS